MKLQRKIATWFYQYDKPAVLPALRELNTMQWRSSEEIKRIQRQHLQALLNYVNVHVPYYRDLFAASGFHPSDFAQNPATFTQLPLLDKTTVQDNYDRLISTEPARQKGLVRTKTGGTTGEPMWLNYDANYRAYNTAHIYQEMMWSGWHVGESQVWLWGHPVIGKHNPTWQNIKDFAVNRLESNAFYMTEESLEKLAVDLERRPGSVLWSYVSSMYRFAQFLEQRGHKIALRAAYTAAEPLYDEKREFIQRVLRCEVFNSYSCVEIGSIATECEQHRGLHIRTRNCYTEVLRDGIPVQDGEEGEFVLTTLTNFGFPLIRYRVADWGKKSTRQCACGRGLPMLEVVEGRIIDHLRTRDGRLVWGAFLIPMIPYLGVIKQYQVVQKSVDLILFKVIKIGPINEDKFHDIQLALKKVLGENVEARLEIVDSLPTTPTGKHRYLVSEVD